MRGRERERITKKKTGKQREKKERKYDGNSGAELGQAQLKLELDFTLIFCRFDMIKLTG